MFLGLYLQWLICAAEKNQFSAEKFQFSAKNFQFSAQNFQFSAQKFNLVQKQLHLLIYCKKQKKKKIKIIGKKN